MDGQQTCRSTPGDDLARRAAAGDAAAFAALCDAEYDRVFRLAWRFTGNRDRAEDIAQDVCVKLTGAIRGFRGESAFSTWLYRLVFTTATDAMRKTQRLVLVEPSKMQLVADDVVAATPESAAIDGELWAAVRALPPQQRDAVTFVYGEDLSHAEAATVMGCTEKTVSWHLHEAKKRLKRALEAEAAPVVQPDCKPTLAARDPGGSLPPRGAGPEWGGLRNSCGSPPPCPSPKSRPGARSATGEGTQAADQKANVETCALNRASGHEQAAPARHQPRSFKTGDET